MTLDQKRPTPAKQSATQAPETAPSPVAENSSSLIEGGFSSLIPDIGAADWVEAARKMGSAGTVVLDAMPASMALPRVHELWDLAYIRDWVFRQDPVQIAQSAPGLALQLVDSLWPVGVALGMDAALKVNGALGGLTGQSTGGGLSEVMRTGAEQTTAHAGLSGGLRFALDPTQSTDTLNAEAGVGVHGEVAWQAPMNAGVDDLLRMLWAGVTGGTGATTDALAAEVEGALGAAQPVWSVGALVDVAACTDSSQVCEDMGALAFPIELMAGAVGDFAAEQSAGVRLEGGEQGMQMVLDLSAMSGLTGLAGVLARTDVVQSVLPALDGVDLAGELVFDIHTEGELADAIPAFRLARLSAGGDDLEFRSAEGLLSYLCGNTLGGGAATMAAALRGSGLSGLSRSVRKTLDWKSELIPEGVLTGMAYLGDPELVLGARVDAGKLADAFDAAPYPVDMALLKLSAEDGLRAALDCVRGQRPPGWWTLTPSQLAGCVTLDDPRVQGTLRATAASARHAVTEKHDTTYERKAQNAAVAWSKSGPAGAIASIAGDEINDATELTAEAEVGMTARMDVPVEAPERTIWRNL
jgi:hypothetical protein